ncbi:class I SAM-dependent methyltransferase [Rhodocytophaga rosea]|uniref:Class I SAM-dependent methyltransferase n=1 Tax=Rhodocytophaga rosea TaxID=2704465 RepID=A0A6C0GPC6_9BACT|nr:class I SAM-dependent methyltransferase [Rhodocytophaga rosea]QHT69908.1 class I SAM-dependent methyltransferase [Rhodocytophaga rosea]
MLLRYLLFLLRSTNEHGIHSPFVFELYTQVIQNKSRYYVFDEIEALRQTLLTSTERITVQDLGAGSKINASKQRNIRDIARHTLKNARTGQLLFRLVNHFQPHTIFDLGTSLGITTLYLSSPSKKSQIFTFEGCPQTLQVAKKHFEALQYSHIISVSGNIDQTLRAALDTVSQVDFVFFDANHRLEPTWTYFQQCLEKAHENSVFVFDDIYWSAQMEQAWQRIKMHPSVMLTIDLFDVGLVFFRKNQPKQHFVLRF